MSHKAARTARFSRSGVPVTSRCTWDADKVMPRSASGPVKAVLVNMSASAIALRSRHR